MKRCLACNTLFASSHENCTACGARPTLIDGFIAFAPDFAEGGGGFKSRYFADLAHLEDVNFWFRARNKIILWALEEYCPDFRSFLEIGCGTGYVLAGVAQAFPHAMLQGSDIFSSGLGFAAGRLPAVQFMQMDARNIPFFEEFEVIGAFDVLEHIEDDELVLSQICAALKPEGCLVLTVPQHPWLWSATDEYACHIRRYTATEIHRKIESSGFTIVRTTSFISSILPAMMVSRFLQGKKIRTTIDATAELKITPWLNVLFFQLLRTELVCIRKGCSFPVGGSRLVVAKKTASTCTA